MNIYSTLLGLSDEERRQLAILTEQDDMLEETLSSCTEFWRYHLRARYPDPSLCRKMFLATSLHRLELGKGNHGFSQPVLGAMLLTLADLVEARVNNMEENHAR